jgi:hypothetical protein
MTSKRSGFVDVDALMREVTLEQAAAFYGVELPAMHRIGSEVRMRCFLTCARHGETGERAISIQPEHPAKVWRCFDAGCGRGGNLLSLCDLMKRGPHAEGKPRGERFKQILADLRAMIAGTLAPATPPPAADLQTAAEPAPEKRSLANPPLSASPNERARSLVNLDEKFLVDVAAMSPRAASYFRRRPFLTPEVCRRWRMGYLPRDTGGDHGGGTMRGKIVYPVLSESGEVLTWFGRDPEYEARHQEWSSGGKQGREPEKFHFVKGFHRGLELFGQHRLAEEGVAGKLSGLGLIVVEGPNDVIALDVLGVPAVGLCSSTVTKEQTTKLARLAKSHAGGVVTLMFDCDPEGESGARQAAIDLAQSCLVRFAWLPSMHGGAFKGRQPESLTGDEWQQLRMFLAEPGADGSDLGT